jgi:ATP-dependent Clp protease ATP-binding subunit ClpC
MKKSTRTTPNTPENPSALLSLHARHALSESENLAKLSRAPEIAVEHLLLALFLETGSLGHHFLQSLGFTKEVLTQYCLRQVTEAVLAEAPLPTVPMNDAVSRTVLRAYAVATDQESSYVGTEHLVIALFDIQHAAIEELCTQVGITEEKLDKVLSADLMSSRMQDLRSWMKSSAKNSPLPFMPTMPERETDGGSALEQFTVNLYDEAMKRGEAVVGRDPEIRRVGFILSRKTKSNALLIGEPGVGKTAIATGLALLAHAGRLGPALAGKRVLSLDLAQMVAGTTYRGEFENRMKSLMTELRENPDVILFIDEIHTLLGAGNAHGALDAANMLKPALARGEIRCIGATTQSEYKKYIEKDPALERRFQVVRVEEPSKAETLAILESWRRSLETHHRMHISSDLLPRVLELTDRHLPERFYPDKALDLLDEACTRAIEHHPLADILHDIEKFKKEAVTMTDSLLSALMEEEYTVADMVKKETLEIQKQITSLETRIGAGGFAYPHLTEAHILEALGSLTNTPTEKLVPSTPAVTLETLEKTLRENIYGQDHVIERLMNNLTRRIVLGGSGKRPLGSYLFLGPTGVGKTYTAKLLAEHYFGDAKHLIRIDMSEFSERHQVAELLGAPAGYIGHGSGGKLTEALRARPHSVVLFDEIEKAHPDILNILLQILDEGKLTDSEGKSADFKHALVIMTSNLGNDGEDWNNPLGFDQDKKKIGPEEEAVRAEVKQYLRPELLARIDDTLVFKSLGVAEHKSVLTKEIADLKKSLKDRGTTVTVGAEVVKHLLNYLEQNEIGARGIRRAVEDQLEFALARHLLAHPEGKKLKLTVKDSTVQVVTAK